MHTPSFTQLQRNVLKLPSSTTDPNPPQMPDCINHFGKNKYYYGHCVEWFYTEGIAFACFHLTLIVLMIKSRFFSIGVNQETQFEENYLALMANAIIHKMKYFKNDTDEKILLNHAIPVQPMKGPDKKRFSIAESLNLNENVQEVKQMLNLHDDGQRSFFNQSETSDEYCHKRRYFIGKRRRIKISKGLNILIKLSSKYFDLIHERLYMRSCKTVCCYTQSPYQCVNTYTSAYTTPIHSLATALP